MKTLTRKLLERHQVDGDLDSKGEVGLRIEQTLTQDATGTLVMLELEAMDVDRVRTKVSAQYVDHNLLQADHRNPDDHLFLESACRRFGVWYSPAGNGVSHPVHQDDHGVPGASLLGSDSHTPAAGGLGMLAFGAGGIEVASALSGAPYYLETPEVWGVELVGQLPPWVSAKDVVLELLRRHGVDGGRGRVIEYFGTGLRSLSVMDRHVIANMGTELGATTSIFPSDEQTRRYLRALRREDDFEALGADEGASYDHYTRLVLDDLEPLIALPSSPGNVVPVSEVAGEPIHQAYIGSSANPGYRDFAMVAAIVAEGTLAPWVSLDVNPASRQLLLNLVRDGHIDSLLRVGARLHQTGCNGCIGMGQAPATDTNSLRTVPRNFPGRSGTREDRVFLCSPETAAASALAGEITDPRRLSMRYPVIEEPRQPIIDRSRWQAPVDRAEARTVELRKGPNIESLPELATLPRDLEGPVLLTVGDDVSTDEILPAGARVLPYRSNIPAISRFAFEAVDSTYVERAEERGRSTHFLVAGRNYGQGSSREHAALAVRHLGLRVVVAESFARIHWQNLVAFGVLPLVFDDPGARSELRPDDQLVIRTVGEQLERGENVIIENTTQDSRVRARHQLSERQVEILRHGSLLSWLGGEKGPRP